ncbi:group II intron reverse transcriptase/maturase [Paeniroseomonas aquatica]|uniref:group II intron reverse transcriptase/maturase n=1 Tax=Paeniroseomonas aquatica TaxID=373043 RepID=UPI00360E61C7
MSQALARVREAAKRNKRERFTALMHHITPDLLAWAFHQLKPQAAPGIDGVTWEEYAVSLDANIDDLHRRVMRGGYRAKPSRRRYIPKPDGRQRPLGIAALEDKVVQRAVVEVLNAIYETDFLGFSYGFRPGRSQHDALDALAYGINLREVNWVLDADIRSFFDCVSHEWVMRFLEHRIGDRRVLRLVAKWLKAGVMEAGAWTEGTEGTPQGAVISPLLANIYLHYVYDLWVEQWRKRRATGPVLVIRYADDTIVGFQRHADADRFLRDLRERLATFGLALHPDKTRLIEFGRFAVRRRSVKGLGKPETFDFLGFTHICGERRDGRFILLRQTIAKQMRAKLVEIKETLYRMRHLPVPEQGRWLGQVARGYLAYHAVPTNSRAITSFLYHITWHWRRALQRRSQKGWVTWARVRRIAARWLPSARINHPGRSSASSSITRGGSRVR